MHTEDVIFAVASPPGRSLRGIVRISGPGALAVVDGCLAGPLPQQRGVHRVRLMLGSRQLPVLALVMPGPHSYTGDDSAELQLPGNPALLQRVLDELAAAADRLGIDARRAEGGEFTARAFFNSKISLTQAEGVAATIAAQSDAELRAAAMLRSGSLGTLAHRLADELASGLALVEAGIDFTDQEDVVAISPAQLHALLTSLETQLRSQLDRSVGMERLEAIPWVVLSGPPNAGKSTLFNALLGRQRAVVSPVAGTTRDVLAEPMHIATSHGDAEVMLVDLAGAEHVDPLADAETLEPQMQRMAGEALRRAELVLACTAADAPDEGDSAPLPQPTIRVRTKCELNGHDDAGHDIAVSAHTGAGLDALRHLVASHLAERAVSLAADVFALTPRHEAALRSAQANIVEAREIVAVVQYERALAEPELVASSMRAALNDLADLTGDITPDDVLGRVFATFCVGK